MDYFPTPADSLPGIDVPLLAQYVLPFDADKESVDCFIESHGTAPQAALFQAVHFFGLIESLFEGKVLVAKSIVYKWSHSPVATL
nr:hypothetical protein B0A51_00371 [Rachicladosporium sp. CCFEE 5018]